MGQVIARDTSILDLQESHDIIYLDIQKAAIPTFLITNDDLVNCLVIIKVKFTQRIISKNGKKNQTDLPYLLNGN